MCQDLEQNNGDVRKNRITRGLIQNRSLKHVKFEQKFRLDYLIVLTEVSLNG